LCGIENKQAEMLRDLLRNAGLLVILTGVVVLAVVVFTKVQTNAHLGLSLALIIGGLIAHIVINRKVD
jgi:hypothetical protein